MATSPITLGKKQCCPRLQPIIGLQNNYRGAELLSEVGGVDNVEDFFALQSSQAIKTLVEQQLTLIHGKSERIFININHHNLCDAAFIRRLLPSNTPLALEIDHLMPLSLHEHTCVYRNIARLHAHDHQIWLDDVKRHTPLATLRYLRWDGIKIDKHYFWRMNDVFLRHAARFYRRYARHILVEGIETETHYQSCRRAGIDLGQGYYWHSYLP